VVLATEYDCGQLMPLIAVDASHLYWTTQAGVVKRGNLDGTGATIIATILYLPGPPVLTATALYWSESDYYGYSSLIHKSNLDGSNAVAIWKGPNAGVTVLGSALYWLGTGYIWTSDLDGTGPRRLTPGSGSQLQSDGTNVYWLGNSGNTSGIMETSVAGGLNRLVYATSAVALANDARFFYFTLNEYGSTTNRGVMRLAK
jgi:hypothetical protein